MVVALSCVIVIWKHCYQPLNAFCLSSLCVGLWNAGSECCIDGTEISRNALPKRYTNHVHRTVTKVKTLRVKSLLSACPHIVRIWEVAPASSRRTCWGHSCAVRSLHRLPSEPVHCGFACTTPCKALCFQRNHSKSTVAIPHPTPLDTLQQMQGLKLWNCFFHNRNTLCTWAVLSGSLLVWWRLSSCGNISMQRV